MTVAIRADASVQIGTGHVMRCLTLAGALREKGMDVSFVCREHPGHLCEWIESAGFPVIRLPSPDVPATAGSLAHSHWLGVSQEDDARETQAALGKGGRCEWLIADHYALDASWESAMRSLARRIMAIDDLADRKHDCDLLLDQNYCADRETRYDERVPPDCRKLLGPRYALLRNEFIESRANLRKRDGTVSRILVFFGGTDPTNQTAKAIESLILLGRPDLEVNVVGGQNNPQWKKIAELCAAAPNFHFHRQVANMAEVMAAADLAIGAGGVAMWERSCLGLPAIVLSIADNQRPGSDAVGRAGGILYLGEGHSVSVEQLSNALKLMCSSPHLLAKMSEYGLGLVDGRGTQRVARRLTGKQIVLRRATEKDCESIYGWRNDEETRRFSGNGAPIPFEDHLLWFKNALANPDRAILIGDMEGHAAGVLRYDREGERAVASVYLVPGNEGRGLGTVLIEEGTQWVKLNWPAVKNIDARIQPGNLASIAAFEEAGFRKQHSIYSKSVRS